MYGIDIAEGMIEYARKNAPKASFEEADFFTYSNGLFHGIVMDAFLHLFPKEDIPIVLSKAKSLLVPRGYGLVCTTKNEESTEGYFEKEDYHGKVKRFRKFWTEQELIETLEQNGLRIIDLYTDYEKAFNKLWMNALFQVVAE
ncbi:class I SAM-dependent methyltransferase [Candidatus Woesearchaeota archaeon]|nr:class I SAM-dependent methyltransferase [Candidatus Woesearchaeota archaeon]